MIPDDLNLDDTTGDAPVEPAADRTAAPVSERLVTTAERTVETPALEASLSAIASAKTETLSSTASAIGLANVAGDADVSFSACSIMYAKGNGSFHQAYASGFIAGNEVSVTQGATPFALARKIGFEQGGALVTVSGKAKVRRSFIGVLMAANAEVSEDTKVLLTGKSVLILAAAMLGGFGLLAIAMYYSANRVAEWRPNISLPTLPSWARHD